MESRKTTLQQKAKAKAQAKQNEDKSDNTQHHNKNSSSRVEKSTHGRVGVDSSKDSLVTVK